MVCPRCITAVTQLLQDMNIETMQVSLGEAITAKELNAEEVAAVKQKLKEQGFELLEENKEKIIDRIKTIVIDKIHHSDQDKVVFSELLASELHKDYSGLSKLFSAEEGITLEHFIILQKTERVKELLLYNEMTLSEIADMMGYSSTAHLSAQFRKITGLTPTAFRKKGSELRKPLDNITQNI